MKYDFELIRCKRSDPRYQEIRNRHYIPNHGTFGQQMHYLIALNVAGGGEKEIIGIISGASAVYAVKSRDDYFGLNSQNKKVALNCIVNNTVFRLEKHLPNLGTQVLRRWRQQVAKDWESRYGVAVHGFETFVIEDDHRKGAVYKADNWDFIGETAGSTKTHKGMGTKHERLNTERKLIFVKKVKGTKLCEEYHATWRGRQKKIAG